MEIFIITNDNIIKYKNIRLFKKEKDNLFAVVESKTILIGKYNKDIKDVYNEIEQIKDKIKKQCIYGVKINCKLVNGCFDYEIQNNKNGQLLFG
jgi:hypothetical protein